MGWRGPFGGGIHALDYTIEVTPKPAWILGFMAFLALLNLPLCGRFCLQSAPVYATR